MNWYVTAQRTEVGSEVMQDACIICTLECCCMVEGIGVLMMASIYIEHI